MFITYHIKARQSLQQFAVAVFQSMSLINNCYTPVDLPQLLQIWYDHLVRCYQHVATEDIGDRMALTNDSNQNTSHSGPEQKEKYSKYTVSFKQAQLATRKQHQRSTLSHHTFVSWANFLRLPCNKISVGWMLFATYKTVKIIPITITSQHSQKCKDPCWQCFCDSWRWPLTPLNRNKWISRTHGGTFLRQTWS